MLGEVEIEGRTQRVLTTPVRLQDKPHCLIVPSMGPAFCPSSSWIRRTLWDVTAEAEFVVEFAHFRISSSQPQHGEIAFFNGEWLIAAITDTYRPDRPDWINVAEGEPIEPRCDLLRFTGWQLRVRGADPQAAPIFQVFPPVPQPFVMVAQ
jgi:hypothetical protein